MLLQLYRSNLDPTSNVPLLLPASPGFFDMRMYPWQNFGLLEVFRGVAQPGSPWSAAGCRVFTCKNILEVRLTLLPRHHAQLGAAGDKRLFASEQGAKTGLQDPCTLQRVPEERTTIQVYLECLPLRR